MKTFLLLFLALVGVAAAFFRPAVPFQVESMPQGAHMGLDNENVPRDDKITPVIKMSHLDTSLTLVQLLIFVSLHPFIDRLVSAASAWDEVS